MQITERPSELHQTVIVMARRLPLNADSRESLLQLPAVPIYASPGSLNRIGGCFR